MGRVLRSARRVLPIWNSGDEGARLKKLFVDRRGFKAILTLQQVKHDVKARLTVSSSGASGGEGARTHIQVLANSLVASILILLHMRQLYRTDSNNSFEEKCWPYGQDLLVVGIVR